MALLCFDHLPRCGGACHGGRMDCDCTAGCMPMPAEAATELLSDDELAERNRVESRLISVLTLVVALTGAGAFVSFSWPLIEYAVLALGH
jgi:hypothetical protein